MISALLIATQMKVVEAFVGEKRTDSTINSSQLPAVVVSLLTEGIAYNTNGSVFTPEVSVIINTIPGSKLVLT